MENDRNIPAPSITMLQKGEISFKVRLNST